MASPDVSLSSLTRKTCDCIVEQVIVVAESDLKYLIFPAHSPKRL